MEELKTARAQLVHARIAPRKVQIVCDMIRGKDTKVAEAEKYDVILQEAVYVNPKLDITDKVIKALNGAK